MKRVINVFAALVAACCLASGQQRRGGAEGRDARAEQELVRLERRLFEATRRHDVDFFRRTLADDYIFTSSGATVAFKPETLRWFSAPAEPDSTLEMLDLRVRVYGETGVATGTSKASWVANGVRTTDRDRFIDVFARRGGRWYLVAGQTTRLSRDEQPQK